MNANVTDLAEKVPHEHHKVTFFVDGQAIETTRQPLSGAQIKALAGRPEGNLLYRVDGRHREEISDSEKVHIHQDECFITVPPIGHAS